MNSRVFVLTLIVFVIGAVSAPILAQDSASMTAPIVRSQEGKVVFTVRFSNLLEGNKYRLGFGGVGEKSPAATVELANGGNPISLKSTEFSQGNTSHWWGVEKLACVGHQFAQADLPGGASELRFQVSLPKEIADSYEKLYLFVSRDYGANTWYLEDGVELEEKDW